jgi:hypothetical protein
MANTPDTRIQTALAAQAHRRCTGVVAGPGTTVVFAERRAS